MSIVSENISKIGNRPNRYGLKGIVSVPNLEWSWPLIVVLQMQVVLWERKLVGRNRTHLITFFSKNYSSLPQNIAGPFSAKFELDEYEVKALPAVSNSLKGVVSKNFLGASLQTSFLSLLGIFKKLFLYVYPLHA